jgi:hypothetical protein
MLGYWTVRHFFRVFQSKNTLPPPFPQAFSSRSVANESSAGFAVSPSQARFAASMLNSTGQASLFWMGKLLVLI